jgi:hypothetical protein
MDAVWINYNDDKDNETKIVRYSLTLYVNTRVSPFYVKSDK